MGESELRSIPVIWGLHRALRRAEQGPRPCRSEASAHPLEQRTNADRGARRSCEEALEAVGVVPAAVGLAAILFN